ncbi:MAG: [protein-PII] uridylyltransferase [Proteobacteria bacterium]|nr:[protein-PII] uridylyltransferase [Pseudomonadota bacterium]HQR02599.1 [protein-PII] uridylyltransferase [Rhodocyclaceae bacterium]
MTVPDSLITKTRARLRENQAALHTSYEKTHNAQALLKGRARLVDRVLIDLWRSLELPPAYALIAVGGYGRGELYPCSDVDLLVLVPESESGSSSDPHLEQLIGLFWDIGLEVGHSVRSPSQCITEAAGDITVQTTLLESRYLAGDSSLFQSLRDQLTDLSEPLGFFKAKRLEQAERYSKYNDTPFSLEPNCKESPGGLRDLHIIQWISRVAGIGTCWKDLTRIGIVTEEESRVLERTERFLQHLRIRLHLLARRREEKLLFDYQEGIAQAMGIPASRSKRASETLMQRYYRNAKRVTQLNTLVLQNIGAHLFPTEAAKITVLDDDFQTTRGLLDMRRADLFDTRPETILRSFLLLQQHSELQGMTARTLRALWRSRNRIDADFRKKPENRSMFLSLFQQKHLIHELRRMNQYDILGRYLPAFGRIVGQLQHDLFHIYTVDQHILQVIRNLRRFSMPEFDHEYPLCSRLMSEFENHWLLYIAALFHDIAKGRGGDHSKKGMGDARRFGREHALGTEHTNLIVFLVEQHLTMSSIAQKQDLSDPDVIARFAAIVRSERWLTALYLLTVADIRGTSPKVWNTWKGKLLEDLYRSTLQHLRGDTLMVKADAAEKQQHARELLRYHGLREGVELPFWQHLHSTYFLRHDAEEIAWHTRNLYYRPDSTEPVVRARPGPDGGGLQIMVYCPDQPDLFARLCGYLAKLGYSILDAKIQTTRHHYALDSFIVMGGTGLPHRDMVALIEHDLPQVLETRLPLPPPVRGGRLSRQVRHFPVAPKVTIEADEKGNRFIMSLTAADRPGLLYAVARVLGSHRVNLETAKISTLGELVEDTFLISGGELNQTSTLVRIEQELLESLQA